MADIKWEIELQELITRREAMVAANRERESQLLAPAYGEKQFTALQNSFECLLERYLHSQ